MRAFGRFLAVILGTIGCLVFLAAAAGSWRGANELRAISNEGFEQLSASVARLDERCEKLETDFDRSFKEVLAVRDRLQQVTERLVEQQVTQTLSRVAKEADPLIIRAEEFLEILSALLNMAESGKGPLGLLNLAGHGIQEMVDDTLKQIAIVRSEVGNYLNDSGRERNRNDLLALVKLLLGKIETVRDGLTALRGYLHEKQVGLSEREQQFDKWIRRAGGIAIAFCLWMFAGQFCLARHACRKPPKPAEQRS